MGVSVKRLTKILALIVLPTLVWYALSFYWQFNSDIAVFWAFITFIVVLAVVIPLSRKPKQQPPVDLASLSGSTSGLITSEVSIVEEPKEPSSWSGIAVLTFSLLILATNIMNAFTAEGLKRDQGPGIFIFLIDGFFMLLMFFFTIISLRRLSSKYLLISWSIAVISTILIYLYLGAVLSSK